MSIETPMKDIVGYEELYAVTEDGRVWSYPNKRGQKKRKGKFLKHWLIGNGYKMVMIYKNKKPKKFLVHRLVALAYVPNPQNLKEVNHKNSEKLDNRACNLEWVTSKQNKTHAWKFGLYEKNRGENHHLSNLNAKKIRQIRALCEKGFKQVYIAKQFGVSPTTISHIKLRKVWFHLI